MDLGYFRHSRICASVVLVLTLDAHRYIHLTRFLRGIFGLCQCFRVVGVQLSLNC